MGLLYYGQNFLIYPSAFPAGARESELFSTALPRLTLTDSLFPHLHYRWAALCCDPDVPVPTDFSIPFTDLELTTPDDVKIKAFLLLQRTVLNMGETPVESDEGLPSDEEVRSNTFWGRVFNHRHFFSLRLRGQRCSCSTVTAGITGIVSHWARSSLARCAATSSCFLIAGTCPLSLCLPPFHSRSVCSYGHSEGTPSEKGA
jgi:hypothetical protein